MSSFISRNFLICVVPTVIVLLSVYWFRKKKKIKQNPDNSSVVSDTMSEKFPLNYVQESLKEVDNISDVNFESDSDSTGAKPFVSFKQTNQSTNNPEIVKSRINNILCKERCTVDKMGTDKGLTSLISNHIENNTYYAKNISLNASKIENQIVRDSDEIPNYLHIAYNSVEKISSSFNAEADISEDKFSHSQLEQEMCSPNQNETIVSALKHSSEDSLSLESIQTNEIKSEDGQSSILGNSSISCISDESESIGFNEESYNAVEFSSSNELMSARLEEKEINRFDNNSGTTELTAEINLDTTGSFPFPLSNDCNIRQEKDPIVNKENDCIEGTKINVSDTIDEDTSISRPSLISAENQSELFTYRPDHDVLITKNIVPGSGEQISSNLEFISDDKLSLSDIQIHSNLLGSSVEQDKILETMCDLNVIESTSIPSSGASCSSPSTASVETAIISMKTNGFCPSDIVESITHCDTSLNDNTHEFTDELTCADSEIRNSDVTDSSIASSSSITPSVISEEKGRHGTQLAEMDISEFLNSDKSEVTNSAEWKMSDIQQSEVLSSSKIGDSLIDVKTGNGTGQYVYEFELPQELCGRLIGKQGKHVKSIKDRSNANVFIKRHPYDPQLKIVVVEGSRLDVDNALEIIRRKYPPSQFPTVSLAQTNVITALGVPLPECLPLHLPDGVSCDVILSSLVSAGHFFLQQPTHPTYPSLSTLDQCMISCYSQLDTPLLPQPVEAGVICAAPVMRGWYRAQVIYVFENGSECEVKFVDYGGFSQVSISSLRQIRSDFMTLPFQATECYLASVRPVNREIGWTAEATATFEELAQGQILQAILVDYGDDGSPYVHLYRVQGISNMFINRELVERGLAVWVDNHWDPH